MSVRRIELPIEMLPKRFISGPRSGCPAVWCGGGGGGDDDDDYVDDDDDDADNGHDDSFYLPTCLLEC
jgi:hypothetical protein